MCVFNSAFDDTEAAKCSNVHPRCLTDDGHTRHKIHPAFFWLGHKRQFDSTNPYWNASFQSFCLIADLILGQRSGIDPTEEVKAKSIHYNTAAEEKSSCVALGFIRLILPMLIHKDKRNLKPPVYLSASCVWCLDCGIRATLCSNTTWMTEFIVASTRPLGTN